MSMTNDELVNILDKAVKNFKGDSTTLESAIGMLVMGRQMGWRVIVLIHDKSTIKKYEKILGVNIREVLPEVGTLAHKSIAWGAVQKVGNFWKAVKGEIFGVRTPALKK
jgi:hypothetical protein